MDITSGMSKEFHQYLSKQTTLSNELIDQIIETAVIKSFKKGTILLREGELSKECYLILKGCIRSYVIKNGEEKTIDFYTEEQPVSPITFGKEIPTENYLECIEDTIATVSTPEHELKMFQQFPALESACRIVTESLMADYQSAFAHYKIDTPEDRYLKLLKERTELIQRVPQYQLASYLGIKPESLSRIRKRVSKKIR